MELLLLLERLGSTDEIPGERQVEKAYREAV
jgi:hypothetical protein